MRITGTDLHRIGSATLSEYVRMYADRRKSVNGVWVCNVPEYRVQEMLDLQAAKVRM